MAVLKAFIKKFSLMMLAINFAKLKSLLQNWVEKQNPCLK